MKRAIAGLVVVAAVVAAVLLARRFGKKEPVATCPPGLVAAGSRCAVPPGSCPAPLARTDHGCDAPVVKVLVPGASIVVGPSDWEAEGLVKPRTVHTAAFRVDAFEFTVGQAAALGDAGVALPGPLDDATNAAAMPVRGVSRDDADTLCQARGGRLPTEDEWMVAAAGAVNPPPRYPWGDTGAVCRRATWGLTRGPCDSGRDAPEPVGFHPDGDTPLGLHDMAGNVAEWVAGEPAVAKGGSFDTQLAADLRVWARLELGSTRGAGASSGAGAGAGPHEGAPDPRVGFRCVYPP